MPHSNVLRAFTAIGRLVTCGGEAPQPEPCSISASVDAQLAALWPAIEAATAPAPVCALCGCDTPRVNSAGVHESCLNQLMMPAQPSGTER